MPITFTYKKFIKLCKKWGVLVSVITIKKMGEISAVSIRCN